MIYPIKTLSQLPLVLKAFRKDKGVTQASMAEKLGITQQSYAYFEAQPTKATLERLFTVLRLLNVDLSLEKSDRAAVSQLAPPPVLTDKGTKVASTKSKSYLKLPGQNLRNSKTGSNKETESGSLKISSQAGLAHSAKIKPVEVRPKKKESW